MPPDIDPSPKHQAPHLAWHRPLAILGWRILAVVAAVLALIGVLLPVMPTVPFVLLAAWAASKGWPAFERWLLAHRAFGPSIVRWREHRAVARSAKWLASLMMLASAGGLQFVPLAPLWLRVAVPLVFLAVAIWLWRRPEA